jgi:hypothetical protein
MNYLQIAAKIVRLAEFWGDIEKTCAGMTGQYVIYNQTPLCHRGIGVDGGYTCRPYDNWADVRFNWREETK